MQILDITSDTRPDVTTNLARGRLVTGDGVSNPQNATFISYKALLRANRGTNTVEYDSSVQATVPEGRSFTIDLCKAPGSDAISDIKTFDRIMVHWASHGGSSNMMAGVPDTVKVEISSDGNTYVDLLGKDFDNTKARSVCTNIILDEPVEARYIRFTPAGITEGSTAYGNTLTPSDGNLWASHIFSTSNGFSGSPARAKASAFSVSGVEIYHSYNYAFVEIRGAGTVSYGAPDSPPATRTSLTVNSTPAERTIKVYTGEALELTFTPTNTSHSVRLFLDGELSNQHTNANGVYSLVLDEINNYTSIVWETYEINAPIAPKGDGNTVISPTPTPTTPDPEDSLDPAFPFTDVLNEHWFYEDVYYMWAEKLMNGMSETLFSPNTTLTRGMVVTVLYRNESLPDISGLDNPFTDVAAEMYYTNAVIWAAENDIVLGYGDGRYGPNDYVTREQLAAILYRYQTFTGDTPSDSQPAREFTDEGSIHDYAKVPVNKLVMQGIINGKTEEIFDPLGNATRAEFAAMLHRYINAVELQKAIIGALGGTE